MSKPAWWPEDIPYVDVDVEYVGISIFRLLTARRLKAMEKTMVACENGRPVAVVLPYSRFIRMQEFLEGQG